MADHPADPQIADLIKQLAPYAPGVAGAILSMAVGENLTLRGRVLSFGAGLAAAVWVAPAISALVDLFWPGDGLPVALVSLNGFVTGIFGFIVIAGLAQALARYAADPLALVKVRVGPVEIGRDA